jgi:hypothetical protein
MKARTVEMGETGGTAQTREAGEAVKHRFQINDLSVSAEARLLHRKACFTGR